MKIFSVYSKSYCLAPIIAAGFFIVCVLGIGIGKSGAITDGSYTDILGDPSSADLYDGTGNAYGLIGNITGMVTGTNGEALSGAEITFDGTTVITGNDGRYAFLGVLKGYALLITARKEKYKPYSVTVDVEQKVDSIVNVVMIPIPDITPPAMVTGLIANVVSSSEIELVWSPSTDDTGVAGYRVYQDSVQIVATTATTYSESTLSPATQYCYTVTAYDTAGNESLHSSQACTTTPPDPWVDITPPAMVTGLIANVVSSSEIELTWSSSTDDTGVAGYRVYRDGVMAGDVAATSHSDIGLSPGSSYCYTVTAYDTEGNESLPSTQACTATPPDPWVDITPPAVVTGLITNVVSSSEIELVWSESTDDIGVAGYRVYRDGVMTGDVAATSYRDIGLSPGSPYCYTVTAYDTEGNESLPGTQACTATPTLATETPSYSVTLAWDAPTTKEDNSPLYNLAGFRVHYGTSPGYYTETIDVGNVLQYSVGNLLPNTYYYFTVTAYDIQGNESGYSEELFTSPY